MNEGEIETECIYAGTCVYTHAFARIHTRKVGLSLKMPRGRPAPRSFAAAAADSDAVHIALALEFLMRYARSRVPAYKHV